MTDRSLLGMTISAWFIDLQNILYRLHARQRRGTNRAGIEMIVKMGGMERSPSRSAVHIVLHGNEPERSVREITVGIMVDGLPFRSDAPSVELPVF